MAKVARGSKPFKGHIGLPDSFEQNGQLNMLSDAESIEAAVLGTVAAPPASIPDFDSLVQLANWQLLDETNAGILRGQQPTEYLHFCGYPKPTIIPTALGARTSTQFTIQVKIDLNNKVGFDVVVNLTAVIKVKVNVDGTRDTMATEHYVSVDLIIKAGTTSAERVIVYEIPSGSTVEPVGHYLDFFNPTQQTDFYGPKQHQVTMQ